MDFSIKTFDAKTTIVAVKTGCIAVGIYENKKLSSEAQALDSSSAISAALKSGDLSGKPGSTLMLRNLTGVAAERVLLVGLGKSESISEKDFNSALHAVIRAFSMLGANDGLIALPCEAVKGRDAAWLVQSAVLLLYFPYWSR